MAAPKADAIIFDMNLDLSMGFTHTDAIGTIDGHEAIENQFNGKFLLIQFNSIVCDFKIK